MVDIFQDAEEGAAKKPVDIFGEQPATETPSSGGLWNTLGEMHAEGWRQMQPQLQEAVKLVPGVSPLPEASASGVLGDVAQTGKSLLGAAAAIPGYIMGAASVPLAHGMTKAERAFSENVKPITHPDKQVPSYEELQQQNVENAQTALSALGTRTPGTKWGFGGTRLPYESMPWQPPGKPGPIPPTSGRAARRAGEALLEEAKDPEALRAKLDQPPQEFVPGSEPTLFQQTGDMGVGGLERSVAAVNPTDFRERWGAQNEARVRALEHSQQQGDPHAVAQHLKDAMREDDARTLGMVEDAKRAAERDVHSLGAHADPNSYGSALRYRLNEAERVAREHETKLWNAVDPDNTHVAGTRPVKDSYLGIYGDLPYSERLGLSPKERAIGELIDNYMPSVQFRELVGLRKAVTEAFREELATNGRTSTYNRLVRLRVGLEDAISNSVLDTATGQFTRAAADRLRAASEATRARATTFNAPGIKEIMRREGLNGPYKITDAGVPDKIFRDGPMGYDTVMAFRRAVGDAEGLPVLRDAAISDLRRSNAIRDGVVNQKALEAWLNKNAPALRAMEQAGGSDFVARLRNASTASDAMAEVANTRQAVMDEHSRGIFGRLIGAEDTTQINRIIGDIFGKQDSISRARALMRRISGNPDAVEGARRSVVEYVVERFLSNMEAGTTGVNAMKANEFQTFLKQNREALGQILQPGQLETWQRISDDIRRANRSRDAVKLPGSNTTQDMIAVLKAAHKGEVNTPPTTMTRLLTYLMTGAAGYIGGMVHSQMGELLAAGVGIGITRSLWAMRDAGVRKSADLLKLALLDPPTARELIAAARGEDKIRGLKTWSMYETAAHSRTGENRIRGLKKMDEVVNRKLP